jgi:hypothetical protein
VSYLTRTSVIPMFIFSYLTCVIPDSVFDVATDSVQDEIFSTIFDVDTSACRGTTNYNTRKSLLNTLISVLIISSRYIP